MFYTCINQPRGCRGRTNSPGGRCQDCTAMNLRRPSSTRPSTAPPPPVPSRPRIPAPPLPHPAHTHGAAFLPAMAVELRL